MGWLKGDRDIRFLRGSTAVPVTIVGTGLALNTPFCVAPSCFRFFLQCHFRCNDPENI